MGSLGPYGLSRDEVREKLGEYVAAVYGFGKMGQPIGGVLAKRFKRVIGVDINPEIVEAVNSGKATVDEPIELDGKLVSLSEAFERFVREGRLEATTDAVKAAREADVHVIIVPTLLRDGFLPDLSALVDVSRKIAKGLEDGDLVIIESTVPPGTTKNVVRPILRRSRREFGLVYSPERTYSGRVTLDIEKRYPKVIGSDDPKALEAAAGIYSAIAEKGVIELPSRLEAEVEKVFEGIYRDVNIALANELAEACEELGCDYHRVRSAANSQPYSHLHLPGAGVGGHCIPVYPRFLIHALSRVEPRLTKLARELNRFRAPKRVVDLMLRACARRKIVPRCVLLFGLAYRGNVKEMRYSPSLRILEELRDLGIKVRAYDPMRTRDEIKRMARREPILRLISGKNRYTNSLEEALGRLKRVNVVILATNHAEAEEFLRRMPVDRKGVIVDARVMDFEDYDPRVPSNATYVRLGKPMERFLFPKEGTKIRLRNDSCRDITSLGAARGRSSANAPKGSA